MITFWVIQSVVAMSQQIRVISTSKSGIQEVEITYKNGDYYKGNSYQGKRMGLGKYKWANGETFSGQFVFGGINKYEPDDGLEIYAGEIYGSIYCPCGNESGTIDYQKYQKCQKNVAAMTSSNDKKQESEDSDKGECVSGNCKNGYGHLQMDWGYYEGNFKDSMFDGMGKLTYTNGVTYVGMFKDDNFNGKGKLSYPNKYLEGNFVGSKMVGEGIEVETMSDGMVLRYEGNFIASQKHGIGKFYLVAGTKKVEIFSGIWKEGCPQTYEFKVKKNEDCIEKLLEWANEKTEREVKAYEKMEKKSKKKN